MGFYAKGNRAGNKLHIETDGCVVNIDVGLTDSAGHQVTSVRVSPDDETRGGDGEGRIWLQNGPRVIRLHEGEVALFDQQDATVLFTAAELDLLEAQEYQDGLWGDIAAKAKAAAAGKPDQWREYRVDTGTDEDECEGEDYDDLTQPS
jgi:hypothetical protein